MCPTCKTRLDQSSSPQANQIRRELGRLRARGESRSEAKRALEARVRLGGAGRHAALGLRRAGLARAHGAPAGRRRARGAAGAPLARRRCARRPHSQAPSATGSSSNSTTSSRGSSEPGDARSGVRRRRALVRDALRAAARARLPRGRAAARRSTICATRRGVAQTLRGVAPFVLGFGAGVRLFGALVGAAGLGARRLARRRSRRPPGSSSSRWDWSLAGALPLPALPGLTGGSRRPHSALLLGGAFALSWTPCVGPVLAAVLALASTRGGAAQAALLLGAYAAGLALPLIASAIAFDRAIGAASFLRDRYDVIRVVSGIVLVALGLLVFFDRTWWLSVAVNRVLRAVGLDALAT